MWGEGPGPEGSGVGGPGPGMWGGGVFLHDDDTYSTP